MTRVTFGKSRVRESRMPGSVRAKPNGIATRPFPKKVFNSYPSHISRIGRLMSASSTCLGHVRNPAVGYNPTEIPGRSEYPTGRARPSLVAALISSTI
ncbi:MAG: hypothetical protein GC191_12090 [Azospirillum sp.]|nr:hypothetical protein [Azospirillum sp.]